MKGAFICMVLAAGIAEHTIGPTMTLSTSTLDQADRSYLPVTIEAKEDVQVLIDEASHMVRGKLYLGLTSDKPFTIRRGERFQMIKIDGEGECRIRFRGTTHLLVSCPWLDGFTDHQQDIFHIIRAPGRRKGR